MKFTKLFSREYSVQYTEQSIRSLQEEVKHLVPSILHSQIYIPENGNETCCAESTEWARFLSALHSAYGKPTPAKRFVQMFHKYGKRYVTTAGQVARGVERSSTKELEKRYRRYQKVLSEYSAFLWMGYLLNNWYSDRAKELLSSQNISDSAAVALTLSPAKRTSILELSDLLAKLKKQGKPLTRLLANKILKKYVWMSCLDIHNNPWTVQELRALYDGVKVLETTTSSNSLFSDYQFSKDERVFLKTVRTMVYVKDMRDEYRRRAVYAALPLFEAIAKKLEINRRDLAFLTEAEIFRSLTDKQALPNEFEIKRRQSGFVIYRQAGNTVVLSDSTAIAKYIADHFQAPTQTTELRGQVASQGTARGRVAIVRGIKDLPNVQPGDILVAVTTHPDFVPAMQRASAFVTDEGGLTSHAAIVAREMKKPCIVGVKQATAMLKDGEMVEVDTQKGIVRKIN